MGDEKTKLAELVEQLALQTMMTEPDDIMGLGSILEKLEKVLDLAIRADLKPAQRLSESLKKLTEKIVLNEISPPQEGMDLLGQGMKLLQRKLSSSLSEPSSPEEDSFWQKTASLIGEPLPDLPKAEDNVPEQAPPQQESSALTQDLDLFHDFISEGLEHLGTIELNIINLEQSPQDKDCINAIFRPFHTIKGVSGFLNLHEINKFSHAMESLLDLARNDKICVDQEVIDFVLEAVDVMRNMIEGLKVGVEQGRVSPPSVDLTPYFRRISELAGQKSLESGAKAAFAPAEPESTPPPLGEILKAKGVVSPVKMNEALKEQAEGKTDLKIGELLVKEYEVKPKDVIDALRDQKRISSQTTEATVKVDTGKLDNLVDLVGELVITQSLVQQNPVFSSIHDQKFTRDFSQLKRITTDLQKNAMSLRMIPIRHTFQKMIRLVRDLARKSGKLADLVMSGEETEIDRNMVDSLYDPLVHMIRNAVDHGIEPPEKRKERGKPQIGQIFLRAYQKGGNVVIEIEDDGQGLNRTKIVKKAREKGLVAEDAQFTDYQIDNLIFEPGFSTADQVTDISGRGVGMDVVKKTIEQLKGKVEIFSVEGRGSRFVIHVPLTLAILDGILVRIGQERYIVPTVFIKETLRPRPEDISSVRHKADLIKIRNNLLPLIRLYQTLGITPEKKEPWEALVIVVENEGQQKCLMVDDLIGKQEVVIKNMGEKLRDVRGVAGASIMGDGRVGLILDIHGIFQMDMSQPFDSPS